MKRLLALLLCGLILAGCVYTVQLPEDALPTKPTEAQPTTVPTEPPIQTAPVTFTLYHGNENADGFDTKEVTIPERDRNLVVEKLIEAGVLLEGTTLLSSDVQNTCLHLDFNEAFSSHLNTMGTAGERMIMGSVVNTFLGLYQQPALSAIVDSVLITVNGEILESGHVIYDFEMTFFE